MTARIERILHKLALQHAPHLTPPNWEHQGDPIERIQTLARRLASYNIVTLVGDLPPELERMKELHIQDWLRGYGQMYALLAQGLFPSYTRLNAYYADDHLPPVAVLQGEAIPVMVALAGFIAPYVAARQTDKNVSDLELRGLMDIVLEELEGRDLPRHVYEGVRETGVTILRGMLRSTVRHISLTAFDKPILDTIQPPLQLPREMRSAPPPPPQSLPEEQLLRHELERLPDDDQPPTATQEMFIRGIPLNRRPANTRRPPVPDLPSDDDEA
jgi:hypothetical protein